LLRNRHKLSIWILMDVAQWMQGTSQRRYGCKM
jgi:hypothetical protein